MKSLLLLFLFTCSILYISAQNVSGLYSGTLTNDSNKRTQNYELALSEYKGKITGYAYTTFVVNDTFYYSVKRVKATKSNGSLIVEDVKMLANNFPSSPSKGVHQITTIPLNDQDSIQELKGSWRTTKTNVFYSIHGALEMKKDNDSLRSPLIQHLYELDVLSRPDVAQRMNNSEQDKISKQLPAKETATDKGEPVIATKPVTPVVPPIPVVPAADKRASRVMQIIDIHSDSLVLSFYDNGIVDGDSISVDFNGERVVSQVKLTAAAAKRIVYLRAKDQDTYQLTLMAESLGTIPPNTGLLVVQDGENRYNIHFTADLQNNAAVIFRKMK